MCRTQTPLHSPLHEGRVTAGLFRIVWKKIFKEVYLIDLFNLFILKFLHNCNNNIIAIIIMVYNNVYIIICTNCSDFSYFFSFCSNCIFIASVSPSWVSFLVSCVCVFNQQYAFAITAQHGCESFSLFYSVLLLLQFPLHVSVRLNSFSLSFIVIFFFFFYTSFQSVDEQYTAELFDPKTILAYMARSIAAYYCCMCRLILALLYTVFFLSTKFFFPKIYGVYIQYSSASLFTVVVLVFFTFLCCCLLVGLIVDFAALLHYSLELCQLLLVVVCLSVVVCLFHIPF